MNSRLFLCAATALALLAPSAFAAKAEPRLLLLKTQSRIEVDAQGNVTAVKTTPQLTPDIEAIIEKNVRQLRFQPPMKDGHAVAGVTYVSQDACAAPVDGSYRFSVKYRGNGPGHQGMVAPAYPRDALLKGETSSWAVEYEVSTDGTGHVVKLERKDRGPLNYDRVFRDAIGKWIESTHFEPEQLDGQAVATRLTDTVDFVLDSVPPSVAKAHEDAANDACKLALDGRDQDSRTVALDSPFKPVAVQD